MMPIPDAFVWPDHPPAYYSSVSSASSGGVAFQHYLHEGSSSALISAEIRKLDALELRGANHNLRASPAVAPDAVKSARQWLEPLRTAATVSGKSWRAPHISASEDGEITFEWWRGNRKITIYFGGQAPEFIKVWGPHIFDQMTSGEMRTSDLFRDLWLWLNAT